MKLSNISWNLAGLAVPLLVAATTVPAIIQIIGLERFGLLALAWGMIGYAGVFDLGIGRATTQLISQLRGQNSYANIPLVVSSATQLTLKTGTAGFVLLSLCAALGVQKLIHHSVGLENELTISVIILAVTIPVQAISATYRGINEAFENFRGISILRMALGVLNFLGPFLIAQFTSSLPCLVGVLLLSRLFALAVFRHLALRCVRLNVGNQPFEFTDINDREIKKRLFAFGGWFTLSSVISPILVQSDRFVIAGVISATAVAAYTIPYELVAQSLIIVGAVTSVAFPSLTKLIHEQPDKWQIVFNRWLGVIIFIMLSVTSLLAMLLPVILPLWIGNKLPSESILIGQILCLGVFANSIGTMYFALLHAKGKSSTTAKIHLFELPLFIVALYLLVNAFGVYGAACAWVGRMMLDTCLLFVMSNRLIFRASVVGTDDK